MTPPHLRLLLFPIDDADLRRDVDAAVARLATDPLAADAAAVVQLDLRRWYRSLSIHERDSLGAYPDDPTRVWYVYRDGRIRKHDAQRERLYQALATARLTCATSEAAVAAAHEAARAAGYVDITPRSGGLEPRPAVRRTAARRPVSSKR